MPSVGGGGDFCVSKAEQEVRKNTQPQEWMEENVLFHILTTLIPLHIYTQPVLRPICVPRIVGVNLKRRTSQMIFQ
jgi:hypothetical protein